jgi:hypothetical protein
MTTVRFRDTTTGETKTLDPVIDAEEINRLKAERLDSLPRYEQLDERSTPEAAYFRNIETGEIHALDSVRDADKIAKLKRERTKDGRFPLHEQTSDGDADPERFASAVEVSRRRERAAGLPLSQVTSDGAGKSEHARQVLEGAAVRRRGLDGQPKANRRK